MKFSLVKTFQRDFIMCGSNDFFQEGVDAHASGLLWKDNPYKEDSFEYSEWKKGWDARMTWCLENAYT